MPGDLNPPNAIWPERRVSPRSRDRIAGARGRTDLGGRGVGGFLGGGRGSRGRPSSITGTTWPGSSRAATPLRHGGRPDGGEFTAGAGRTRWPPESGRG